MRVGEVMTREVVTVAPDGAVPEAAGLLGRHGFTVLPVVEAGRLVGVVGESDVLEGRIHHDARSPRLAGELDGTAARRVREVMTTAVRTTTPGADVADVADLVDGGSVRSLPVVDGDELVGIITRRDLVRAVGRDDTVLQTLVGRKLRTYAGSRWAVHVHDGEATLCDEYGDPTEQHTARVIAGAVPGVVRVETVHRDHCPYRHATA